MKIKRRTLSSLAAAAAAAVMTLPAVFVGYGAAADTYFCADDAAAETECSLDRKNEHLKDGAVNTVILSIEAEDAAYINEANKEYFDYIEAADGIDVYSRSDDSAYVYSTDYFYDQLDEKGRRVWDKLKEACEDFDSYTGDINVSYLKAVIGTDFSADEETIRKIYQMFYYSNPQYYFLLNGVRFFAEDEPRYEMEKGTVIFSVDPDFKSYSERLSYSSAIRTIADEWISEINQADDYMEKERIVYEHIRDHVSYMKTGHHQSMAGALVDGKCVCNGYALAAEYFLNAAGFECITAVSTNHVWNMIDLYGTWYELDVTWLDTGGNDTRWINKSHQTFLKNDSGSHHEYQTSEYEGLFELPDCPSDTVEPDPFYYNSPVSLKINGEAYPCGSLEEALGKMTSAGSGSENYDIILRNDSSVPSFYLPAKAGAVRIRGNGHAVSIGKGVSLQTKYKLELDDITLDAGDKNKITINTADDLILKNVTLDSGSTSFKGSRNHSLTIAGECTYADVISGFGSVCLDGKLTSGKTFSAGGLELLSAETVFTVGRSSAVKITDIKGTRGSAIDLSNSSESGFRPVSAAHCDTSDGRITLINALPGKILFNSKTLELDSFEIGGDHTLVRSGTKISIGDVKFELRLNEDGGDRLIGRYASFGALTAKIEELGDGSASYTALLLDDYVNDGSVKFPKKGTYGILTITSGDSEMKQFGYTGSFSVSSAEKLLFKKIRFAKVDK